MTEELRRELQEQFIEMAQIKSEIDIEKFTIRKEGNFIGCQFHMLMRQYSLTLGEWRRMSIDQEEKQRLIKKWQRRPGFLFRNKDLKLERLNNEIDGLEIQIAGKRFVLEYYEKCRQKLIYLNGGKAPTNRQYQAEQPAYYRWWIQQKVMQHVNMRATGVSEGILNAIDMLTEKAILKDEYQVLGIEVPQNGSEAFAIASELYKQRFVANRFDIQPEEQRKIEELAEGIAKRAKQIAAQEDK